MYEKFTDRARKACALANKDASMRQSENTKPENYLFALLQDQGSVACTFLAKNVLITELEEQLVKRIPPFKEGMYVSVEKVDESTHKVIYAAINASRNLNNNHVGTEHLLIGLATTPSMAQEVLRDSGIIEKEILTFLTQSVKLEVKSTDKMKLKEIAAAMFLYSSDQCDPKATLRKIKKIIG